MGNSFISICEYPEIIQTWDFEKNIDVDPQKTSHKSSKKIWWKCSKGHSYQSPVARRTSQKSGCPYCSGRYAIRGETDLATTHPELIQLWNPEKNGDITPYNIKAKSNKKVWWTCEKGHNFFTEVYHLSSGRGCPYCSGRQVITGETDLLTLRPDIAAEWDYEKNEDLTPDKINSQSSKKVWWKCSSCEYEWQTTVNSRAGCPNCSKRIQTSFPEQAIYFYIKQCYPDAINRYHTHGIEFDIFIPSKNTAIEYDGEYYHKSNIIHQKDNKKDFLCNQIGIKLIRFRSTALGKTDYATTIVCDYSSAFDPLEKAINILFDLLSVEKSPDISIERDCTTILYNTNNYVQKNSLAELFPKISQQWHPTKNNGLSPSYVFPHTNKKAWWICEKNHEWEATVGSRTSGCGCPYCSGKRVIIGENDLLTLRPDIASEWNYEKNSPLTPQEVTSRSSKRVWWKCSSCENEWESTVLNRKSLYCPKCSFKFFGKIKTANAVKSNNLCDKYPEIATQWHPTKNGDIKAADISSGNGKLFWWICDKGHEWKSSPNNRTKDNLGCPYCGNQKVLVGYNDLASKYPDIANEWNYQKNKDLLPSQFISGSAKKVWWICDKGHEWKTEIRLRVQGSRCPICSKKKNQ